MCQPCSGHHSHLSSPKHWTNEHACEIMRSFSEYPVKDLFAKLVTWYVSSIVVKGQLSFLESGEVIAAYNMQCNSDVIACSGK